jgi:hypothetical protein
MPTDPEASHLYWPDARSQDAAARADSTRGLLPWSWAVDRLEKSHNYWVGTARPNGRPHLMIVWGIWREGGFWFTTGRGTRKARNLAANPNCSIATEEADEAVIVEGQAREITDAGARRAFVPVYNAKYGGDIEAMLGTSDSKAEAAGSALWRVQPQAVFGLNEHAEVFVEAATRWTFPPSSS